MQTAERLKTIVIIEDDEAISDVLGLLFRKNGFSAVQHKNGEFVVNREYQHADLYLIDRQLAGVDGLDLCRILKEDPVTLNIPVLIFSASPYIYNRAIAAGANGFIEKPFANADVLSKVNALLAG